MFLGILEHFKNCFVFVYQTLDSMILVGESSVLDFLLVFFLAGVFLPLFAIQFGGRGISSAGSSAINAVRQKEKDKKQQNERRSE